MTILDALSSTGFFLLGGWLVAVLNFYTDKSRDLTRAEKALKFIDTSECEEAHTKRGQCKMGPHDYRCTICEARKAMAE